MGIYLVLAFFLTFQSEYGGRFFLPIWMRKAKYDYMRKIHQGENGDEGAMEDECIICLGLLNDKKETTEPVIN